METVHESRLKNKKQDHLPHATPVVLPGVLPAVSTPPPPNAKPQPPPPIALRKGGYHDKGTTVSWLLGHSKRTRRATAIGVYHVG
jgi:hypothetical protein